MTPDLRGSIKDTSALRLAHFDVYIQELRPSGKRHGKRTDRMVTTRINGSVTPILGLFGQQLRLLRRRRRVFWSI